MRWHSGWRGWDESTLSDGSRACAVKFREFRDEFCTSLGVGGFFTL